MPDSVVHNALVMIFRNPDGSHRGYVASCLACGWDGTEQMAADQVGVVGARNQRDSAHMNAQREAERHNGFTVSGLLLPPGIELPKEVYEP